MVWLSAVTWDFPLVGRTRMLAEAWAAIQQPTTFVQIPSYRTAAQRLAEPLRGPGEIDVVRTWPTYPLPMWPRIGEQRLRRSIRRRADGLRVQLARRIDVREAVGLVVSPRWTPWLDALPFRALVYDCIDDVEVMTPRAELLPLFRRWERELIERADAVVTSADALASHIAAVRDDVAIETIRNGVDVEAFQRRAEERPRPSELPDNPERPLVGFVGALYEWIDWPLIAEVAAALPGSDFVFVGPGRGDAQPPEVGPNVHLLGPRPYEQIPAYIDAFDVCWVPFRRGPIAELANPVKIYEYLALGKPVVSTPIADAASFEDHVAVGGNAGEIADLLRRALQAHDGGEPRRAFARRSTWHARACRYRDFVHEVADALADA